MENHEDSKDQDDNNQEITCPLFMQSLPRDFAHNPSLAALASLLDDDGDQHDPLVNDMKSDDVKDGGEVPNAAKIAALIPTETKIRSTKSRSSRRRTCLPYSRPEGKKTEGKHRQPANSSSAVPPAKARTVIGEAQLFLKMWKL
jgi:hypothetical protein